MKISDKIIKRVKEDWKAQAFQYECYSLCLYIPLMIYAFVCVTITFKFEE